MRIVKLFTTCFIFAISSGTSIAGEVTIPNSFSANSSAVAADVNTNFNAVKTAVDDNDSRISSNADDITALAVRIATLETHLADLNNPHEVSKAQIGLANVEDISVNFSATIAPTINDDSNSGYAVGSVWVDVIGKKAYVLVDSAPTSAVWKQITNFYEIGDMGPAGGLVFYVADGGLSGLEAAPVDQLTSGDSATAVWCSVTSEIAGADGTAIGTGAANTADIIAGCAEADTAAKIADTYSLNGHNDWYLPSLEELHLMWENLADTDGDNANTGPDDPNNLGGFVAGFYWSSSESSINNANNVLFSASGGDPDDKRKLGGKNSALSVRAIRSF
jgi:hypothetical protein